MKKLLVILVLAALLVAAIVPVALAWYQIQGCIVDNNGNPWTYGGSWVNIQNGQQTSSGTLDANGCFAANALSTTPGTVTIDLNAGPAGDPANQSCSYDAGLFDQPYSCGPISTGTGPNAIVWQGMSASTASAVTPVALGLLSLVALGAVAALWRRKQLAM